MLYAATKATLLQDLGGSKFVDTLYGTTPDDLSLDGYRRHIKHKDASAPLTEREQEQAAMRAAECTADVGSTSRKAHTSKTGNPLAEDGTAALLQLKEGAVKSVVLYMSLETEKISVKETGQKGFADLSSLVEPGAPRFVFFSYDTDSYAFVYVCPPAAKIREKMVYSTFRNSLILAVENDMEIKLTQKIEVDAIDELENPEHVSPVGTPETVKKSFGRPARPGRGPARVSRPTTPSSDL
ncbi:Twinfilin-1 [Thoreauomyces humboldtii]|nr:Twinfilin-1 [Thoreauomyces humboldtii]